MAFQQPASTDGLVYYTNRELGDKGKVLCWVPRSSCPKCGKGLMGKPVDAAGKVKIRAKEYVCPACRYTAEKEAYEETLTATIIYTCPACSHAGELQLPFRRKKVGSVAALPFACQQCGEKIIITKKMKAADGSGFAKAG